ncbi:MAG: hypothetical protein R3D70_12170 [Rhizobiaceae bacterium]
MFSKPKIAAAGKLMGGEIVKAVASNDNWAGLREVNVGANLAGSVGSYTNARAAGTAMAPRFRRSCRNRSVPWRLRSPNAADQLGVSAKDLATVISYETGGTFSTSANNGQGHIGLIQFGPAEQKKYGAYLGQAFEGQMQAAIRYLKDRGLQPGMGLLDLYSTINAGRPGLYNRSDAANGGAPGTVLDKVLYQMEGHKKNADKILGQVPGAVQTAAEKGTKLGSATGVKAGLIEGAEVAGAGGGGNGFSALAGMAGSALGGFSSGYQSANPLMGALGGGVQGWGAGASLAATGATLFGLSAAALPVIGPIVGAPEGFSPPKKVERRKPQKPAIAEAA